MKGKKKGLEAGGGRQDASTGDHWWSFSAKTSEDA